MTSQFASAVASLPLAADDDSYGWFIEDFGTHMANEETFGAKFMYQNEVTL